MIALLLTLLVLVQFAYRERISRRLPDEIDYAFYGLYSVVKRHGGRPGPDFEVCWGVKYLCYLIPWWAQLVRNDPHSPRTALNLWTCATTILVFLAAESLGVSPGGALFAAFCYAASTAQLESVSYSGSPESLVQAFICLAVLSYQADWGFLARGVLLALPIAWLKVAYAWGFAFLPLELVMERGSLPGYAVVFLLTLLATLGWDRLAGFRSPRECFGELAIYVGRKTTVTARKPVSWWIEKLTSSFAAKTLFLWLCLPLTLFDPALAVWALFGLFVVVWQAKFYPLHLLILYAPLSIAAGKASESVWLLLLLLPPLVFTLIELARALTLDAWGLTARYNHVAECNKVSDMAAHECGQYLLSLPERPRCLYVHGTNIQPYFTLDVPPPGPIPVYDDDNLLLPRIRRELAAWLSVHEPEFIYYSDLVTWQPPVEVFAPPGTRYELERTFRGRCPLFRLVERGLPVDPEGARRRAFLIDNLHTLKFVNPLTVKQPISRESLARAAQRARSAAGTTGRLYLWGDPGAENVRELLAAESAAPAGAILSVPDRETLRGMPVLGPDALRTGDAVLIGARGFQSVAQIMAACAQRGVAAFPLVDLSGFARLRETTGPVAFALEGSALDALRPLCGGDLDLLDVPLGEAFSDPEALAGRMRARSAPLLLTAEPGQNAALRDKLLPLLGSGARLIDPLIDPMEALGFSIASGKQESLSRYVEKRLGLDHLGAGARAGIVEEGQQLASRLFAMAARQSLVRRRVRIEEGFAPGQDVRLRFCADGLVLSTLAETPDICDDFEERA